MNPSKLRVITNPQLPEGPTRKARANPTLERKRQQLALVHNVVVVDKPHPKNPRVLRSLVPNAPEGGRWINLGDLSDEDRQALSPGVLEDAKRDALTRSMESAYNAAWRINSGERLQWPAERFFGIPQLSEDGSCYELAIGNKSALPEFSQDIQDFVARAGSRKADDGGDAEEVREQAGEDVEPVQGDEEEPVQGDEEEQVTPVSF